MKNHTEYAKRLAFWEKLYPGLGDKLLEIVGPFYGWKAELKSAKPNLDHRLKASLPWMKIERIKVIPASQELELMRGFYDSFVSGALADGLWGPHFDVSGHSLAMTFDDTSFSDACDQAFGENIFDPWISGVLNFPYYLIRMGWVEQAKEFKPLLEILREGVRPMAFNRENDLLVLVGDAP